MIDFVYRPQVDIPHELPPYDKPDISALAPHYEVIVIGSGAGGGVMARKLTEAGVKVLCLERGRYLNRADVPMDHLRNHRYSRYGHNVGPDLNGHPRVIVTASGRVLERKPHQGGYSNGAMGVGGGTRVWGAQAWRFAPLDFRLASYYGVPAIRASPTGRSATTRWNPTTTGPNTHWASREPRDTRIMAAARGRFRWRPARAAGPARFSPMPPRASAGRCKRRRSQSTRATMAAVALARIRGCAWVSAVR